MGPVSLPTQEVPQPSGTGDEPQGTRGTCWPCTPVRPPQTTGNSPAWPWTPHPMSDFQGKHDSPVVLAVPGTKGWMPPSPKNLNLVGIV